MTITVDGTAGITFPNNVLQAGGILVPPTTQTYSYTDGTSKTWTKPSTATWVLIELWGGGGSGARGRSGTGAGGGGGGGSYNQLLVRFSDLQGTVTYIVGSGGAAQTVNNTAGNAGNVSSVTMATFAGGTSKTIYAYGGGGGSTSGGAGGGGGGIWGAGGVGGTFYGGLPHEAVTYGPDTGFGGANGSSAPAVGSQAVYGGAGGGGGSSTTTVNGGNGGVSMYGGGGGAGSCLGGSTGIPGTGGVSIYGGNGGDAAEGTVVASDGAVPGGGGGGSDNANSGAGGNGQVRFTYW